MVVKTADAIKCYSYLLAQMGLFNHFVGVFQSRPPQTVFLDNFRSGLRYPDGYLTQSKREGAGKSCVCSLFFFTLTPKFRVTLVERWGAHRFRRPTLVSGASPSCNFFASRRFPPGFRCIIFASTLSSRARWVLSPNDLFRSFSRPLQRYFWTLARISS